MKETILQKLEVFNKDNILLNVLEPKTFKDLQLKLMVGEELKTYLQSPIMAATNKFYKSLGYIFVAAIVPEQGNWPHKLYCFNKTQLINSEAKQHPDLIIIDLFNLKPTHFNFLSNHRLTLFVNDEAKFNQIVKDEILSKVPPKILRGHIVKHLLEKEKNTLVDIQWYGGGYVHWDKGGKFNKTFELTFAEKLKYGIRFKQINYFIKADEEKNEVKDFFYSYASFNSETIPVSFFNNYNKFLKAFHLLHIKKTYEKGLQQLNDNKKNWQPHFFKEEKAKFEKTIEEAIEQMEKEEKK